MNNCPNNGLLDFITSLIEEKYEESQSQFGNKPFDEHFTPEQRDFYKQLEKIASRGNIEGNITEMNLAQLADTFNTLIAKNIKNTAHTILMEYVIASAPDYLLLPPQFDLACSPALIEGGFESFGSRVVAYWDFVNNAYYLRLSKGTPYE